MRIRNIQLNADCVLTGGNKMFFLCKWDKLPEYMKNDEVRKYYDILSKKKLALFLKRLLDIIISCVLIIILIIPMAVIAIIVKCDSKGPVLFRQVRVTTCGKRFRIFKFRTMVEGAENLGGLITEANDKRVTKIGEKMRKYRIDEFPQVFNVLMGDMSFVGTRPEVEHYVDRYTDEMNATLLMPAGITSLASIKFKDEEKLLDGAEDPDEVYVNSVLPQKMVYNLEYIRKFNFFYDIKLMFMTFWAVIH